MRLNDHVLEETLEAYILGRLGDEDIDRVDDHVLVCEKCRLRMEEAEQFIQATRVAALRIRREESFFHEQPRPWWQRALRPLMARPAWAVAGLVILGVAFLLPVSREGSIIYQDVPLRSMRGGESPPAQSSGNVRYRLRLDIRDLSANQLDVKVVDDSGNPVWETRMPRPGSDELAVAVERKLSKGAYWVRLFDTAGKLLREYPLRVS